MKIQNIVYTLVGLFLLTSCSLDFLDRNPLDEASNESFWKTEKDAMAAATGCYNDWFSLDQVLYMDCASDNAYNQYSWEGYWTQAAGLATPSDPGTETYIKYNRMVRYNNFLEN
ncbi:MAG: RagB/SusD family nutrient uptake outer membrane protein, partial [Bacteroides sp.]